MKTLVMNSVVSFLVGLLFAFGLGISGMTLPERVLGFLTVSEAWDPRLLGVMVGALVLYAIAFRFVIKRKSPFFDRRFHLPTKNQVDRKLIFGAAIFGLGWGLAGYCPGPAITASVSGALEPLIFVLSMFAGMGLFLFFE